MTTSRVAIVSGNGVEKIEVADRDDEIDVGGSHADAVGDFVT
jgi:hypothetical protein